MFAAHCWRSRIRNPRLRNVRLQRRVRQKYLFAFHAQWNGLSNNHRWHPDDLSGAEFRIHKSVGPQLRPDGQDNYHDERPWDL